MSSLTLTRRTFEQLTRHPVWATLLGLILIVCTASGLTRLVKDTSVEAFIPPEHPALVANEITTERFGLSDAIAVAVLRHDDNNIFTHESLTLVNELTEALMDKGVAWLLAIRAMGESLQGDIVELDRGHITKLVRALRQINVIAD